MATCQYSCLEDTMDRRAWRAIVHGVAKSLTRLKQLRIHLMIALYYLKVFSLKFLLFPEPFFLHLSVFLSLASLSSPVHQRTLCLFQGPRSELGEAERKHRAAPVRRIGSNPPLPLQWDFGCSVAESCLTLCNPMNCRPPVASAHGILQVRILLPAQSLSRV